MLDRRRFLGLAALTSAGRVAPAGAAPRPDPAAPALPFDAEVARALAAARRASRRFPGMVAAILRKDRLTGVAAEGARKLGAPDPVEVGDRFHLGSCTKAMTATWAGMAIDAGRLRWDTTLAAAFPDLADRMHPDYRAATLAQLLEHRAGLPANVDWWGAPANLPPPLQRRWVAASALGRRPTAAPGSAFGYSNLGYVLAGAMVEAATGVAWEDGIRRQVFGPLGMASAGFGPPGSARDAREPWGHKPVGPLLIPARDDNPPVMGPAGTVHASVVDWARFAAFHLGDGAAGTRRLLSRETFAELHTAAPGQTYAGGWLVSGRARGGLGPILEHAGSNTVWFAIVRLFPRANFGVLTACNAGGPVGESACTRAADALQALEPITRA